MTDKMPKKNLFSSQINLNKFKLASEDEKRQKEVMSESTTFFKDGMKKLMRNPLAVGSIIVLAVLILTIIVAPMIVPYGYEEINNIDGRRDRTASNLGPFQYSETEQQWMEETGESRFPHIFGTDSLGRDYFMRVIYGTRVSLLVGFFASILVMIIGVLYGSVAGYAGGKVDLIMMRICDIIYSLPDLLMVILLSVVLDETLGKAIEGTVFASVGSNMLALFIVFALLYWVGMARLVRGQILTVKENEYVLAARTIGTKPSRILRKHILPNCLSVIIISVVAVSLNAIFTESYLSFLGLGVSAPMPSLGSLANSARGALTSYPHQLVFPAVMICLIVLAFNLLGDGLRDAFDPKLRR